MAKPKVFILEDDPSIAAAVRSSFEDEFELIPAEWTQTAVLQIHEQMPLVTLLALESSSNSVAEGYVRVLQELRQTGHGGKVIAYTESTERSLAVRAVQQGAYDVLSKPLDMSLLRQIIRRAARVADLERDGLGVTAAD